MERERTKKKKTREKEETQKNKRKVETVAQPPVSRTTQPSPLVLPPAIVTPSKSSFFPLWQFNYLVSIASMSEQLMHVC